MKKFERLPLAEAIRHYVEKKTPSGTNDTGASVKDDGIKVSIIIPTHAIAPDYKQDSVNLKSHVTEAEKKLRTLIDKKELSVIMENIKEVEKDIDHSHNLQSLVLFADKNLASVVKLPVELKPEVLISDRFDVRPLFKSRQQLQNYYILAVSQNKVRLFQALGERIIEEFHNEDFPFENEDYYTDDPEKLAQDIFKENLIKEFFNVADKRMKSYLNELPLPLIIAGDVKTVAYYQEIMDNECLLIGTIHGNFDNTPEHEVIKEAYPLMEHYIQESLQAYTKFIEEAQSGNRLVTDANEIYRLASNGNVDSIFIGNNFSLKGKIKDNLLVVDNSGEDQPDSQELVLNIIEKVQESEGRIVFLDDNLLDPYLGIALVKRY